ncbi:hypothetical protein [Viscerimonas tarda]
MDRAYLKVLSILFWLCSNMIKRYCVFWYPTIFYVKEDFPAREYYISGDLSDGVGDPFKVRLDLRENKNITITSLAIPNNCQDFVVELRYEDYSRNGLFLYSYEIDESAQSPLFAGDGDERWDLPVAIYHLAKGFYHDHEHHEHGEDSILKAYFDEDYVFIHTPDNKALMHYLFNYEKIFKALSDSGSIFLSQIRTTQRSIEENQQASSLGVGEIDRLLVQRNALNLYCDGAIGQYTYYRCLFNSKYNRSFCPPHQKSGLEKGSYKWVQNIENARRNIKTIRSINHTEFDLFAIKETTKLIDKANAMLISGDKIAKQSKYLGWVSAILGVISVGLAIWVMLLS